MSWASAAHLLERSRTGETLNGWNPCTGPSVTGRDWEAVGKRPAAEASYDDVGARMRAASAKHMCALRSVGMLGTRRTQTTQVRSHGTALNRPRLPGTHGKCNSAEPCPPAVSSRLWPPLRGVSCASRAPRTWPGRQVLAQTHAFGQLAGQAGRQADKPQAVARGVRAAQTHSCTAARMVSAPCAASVRPSRRCGAAYPPPYLHALAYRFTLVSSPARQARAARRTPGRLASPLPPAPAALWSVRFGAQRPASAVPYRKQGCWPLPLYRRARRTWARPGHLGETRLNGSRPAPYVIPNANSTGRYSAGPLNAGATNSPCPPAAAAYNTSRTAATHSLAVGGEPGSASRCVVALSLIASHSAG